MRKNAKELNPGERLLAIAGYASDKHELYIYSPAKKIKQTKMSRSISGPWDAIIKIGQLVIKKTGEEFVEAIKLMEDENAIYGFDNNSIFTEDGLPKLESEIGSDVKIFVVSWDDELKEVSRRIKEDEEVSTYDVISAIPKEQITWEQMTHWFDPDIEEQWASRSVSNESSSPWDKLANQTKEGD